LGKILLFRAQLFDPSEVFPLGPRYFVDRASRLDLSNGPVIRPGESLRIGHPEAGWSCVRYDLLKILLVDDNHYMRVLLAEILRALGVQHIFEAGDGAQGLQMLRDHQIDVVMTDLSMQPLDGIDFVRMIRTSPDSANPMIPVVMITGHSTFARVNEARDAGVSEFLAKPLTARGVVERLHQAVEYPRPFVRTDTYFGPDRRRRADAHYKGPWRRANGNEIEAL
jgi:CheY-like chemotaxis protein